MLQPELFLQINPRFVPAWQDNEHLRFGFTKPQLVLSGLSSGALNLVHALLSGISANGLNHLATRYEVSHAEYEQLLRVLTPVLDTLTKPRAREIHAQVYAPIDFAVDPPLLQDPAGMRTAKLLAQTLEPFGMRHNQDCPQVLVTVNRYLQSAKRSLHWSRNLLTQVPVVFAESKVILGPIINESGFMCAQCAEATQLAADPLKPVLAAQLLAYRAVTESENILRTIAPQLAALITKAWLEKTHPELYADTKSATRERLIFDFDQPLPTLAAKEIITARQECMCAHEPQTVIPAT